MPEVCALLKKHTALLLSALGVGGLENKDLNGADTFECLGCGLRIDRQLNAAINLYARTRFGYTVRWEGGKKHVEPKVEGASQRDWWDRTVLPSLLGGCVLAEA